MSEGDYDSIQGKTRAEVRADKGKRTKRKKLARLKQRRSGKNAAK